MLRSMNISRLTPRNIVPISRSFQEFTNFCCCNVVVYQNLTQLEHTKQVYDVKFAVVWLTQSSVWYLADAGWGWRLAPRRAWSPSPLPILITSLVSLFIRDIAQLGASRY